MYPDTNQTDTQTGKPVIDVHATFKLLNARLDDEEFQNERKARNTALATLRKYFDGDHPQSLKVRDGDKDPNVIINLCSTLVKKSVAWLFGDLEDGEMIKFTIKQADKPKANAGPVDLSEQDYSETPNAQQDPSIKAAEQYLSDVWEANGGAKFLLKIGRRVGVTGHGFIKILPPNDVSNTLGLPRLILLKAEIVSVLRKQDDSETLEAYVIEWSEKRLIDARLRDVCVRQIITNVQKVWLIGQFVDTGRGKDKWEEDPTKLPAIEVWPYDWCPIVDWQNLTSEDYYGESDLKDLPVLNDAVNFTASNVNRILYIHGHPRTIGTGFEASELQDTAVDSFWTIPSKDAKVNNLEMQSDLTSAFSFLQFIYQSFWDIGRDLSLSSLRDRIGQVTNFGLRVLANDALSKLGEKRLSYGKALKQINNILLELGNYAMRDTEVNWLQPLPEDSTEEVDRLKMEVVDMKTLSRETASEELGHDWEQEKPRIEQEQANMGAAVLKAFDQGGGITSLPKAKKPLPPTNQGDNNAPNF